MSRLIDADKLLEELRQCHPLSISYGILSDIEYFPTAYDADNVRAVGKCIVCRY